jgi:hypothetical protein
MVSLRSEKLIDMQQWTKTQFSKKQKRSGGGKK